MVAVEAGADIIAIGYPALGGPDAEPMLTDLVRRVRSAVRAQALGRLRPRRRRSGAPCLRVRLRQQLADGAGERVQQQGARRGAGIERASGSLSEPARATDSGDHERFAHYVRKEKIVESMTAGGCN